MKDKLINVLKTKTICYPLYLYRYRIQLDLSDSNFIFLTYLMNYGDKLSFDVEQFSKDLLFTWALFDKSDNYHFSKIEEQFMNKVRKYLDKDILNKRTIYEMGLYLSTLIAEYKDINKDKIFKLIK